MARENGTQRRRMTLTTKQITFLLTLSERMDQDVCRIANLEDQVAELQAAIGALGRRRKAARS